MQRKVEVSGRLGSASVFGSQVLGEELNNHATLTIPRIIPKKVDEGNQ